MPTGHSSGFSVVRLGFRVEAAEGILRWIRMRAATRDVPVRSCFPRCITGYSAYSGHVQVGDEDGSIHREAVDAGEDPTATVVPAPMLGFLVDDLTACWDIWPAPGDGTLEHVDLLLSLEAPPESSPNLWLGLHVALDHPERGECFVDFPAEPFGLLR
jgi:hypothetical protein